MRLIKNLLQRRVPQILGIYLATSWAIIEFLDWLINQFSISPHLPKFVLLTLVFMIPTVLLLAWFHGKPGKDEWTKVEKIGIPSNVVAAILILIFVFNGKQLGATTSLLTLEDEEGQVIERVVPKSEFRKKIMLFFLENASGDTTLNWLSYGITDMFHMDLHLDYFLTGSFTREDQQYQVDAKLYHSRNGKLINQFTLSDENVFNLVDQLTVHLKHDLQIPDYHIEETNDLPVSEITSASLVAYESYSKGSSAFIIHQDWVSSMQHVNEAIKADSTFALAYLSLYQLYLLNNQTEQAAWVFDPLMSYLYKLPEKLQYMAKASYYEQKQDFDRQYSVYEMLVSLYPDDIQARQFLIQIHELRNELDEAIACYQYILDLDPAPGSAGTKWNLQGKGHGLSIFAGISRVKR
ncbi:MAG: tetratricopeptide repeat protein [Bacteroidota bacterium]|nr:tetratricopeptide repeat protein [Bacteroidota bacterium]